MAVAVQISAYSLKALADVVPPLMTEGGSLVGLDFDASRRLARPTTGWAWPRPRSSRPRRYLARDLGPKGIRVNLVAAGPVRTMAAKSIPGFGEFEDVWDRPGPARLGRQRLRPAWPRPCVALLSDWFPQTTGEIIHVDGGYHATMA